MVFFTCNACGQSIRKSRVEKHWQTECRNCEVLSCMDCGKDFYGDEYAAHTSCISEAEKYQGALFKGEKGGSTKGEKKQQEWIHNLQEMMSTREFPPRIKGLLERILEYPNIPRKKAKFQNFLKNSINVRDRQTLEKLWEIFDEAGQTKVVATTADTPTDTTTTETTSNEADSGIEKEEVGNEMPAKKKRKKKDQSEIDKIDDQNGITEHAESDKPLKKKKKKSKEKENDCIDIQLNDVTKKKSKKRKREEENGYSDVDEVRNVKTECSVEKKAKVDAVSKSKKKKKQKQ